MRFSVIVPLYNKAPFVEKAIRSILSQTLFNWELIVVDDGSTDKSVSIAEKVIQGDSRCRILRQENSGVAVARNNGVLYSSGEYLAFLDADDWWEPTFLEEMDRFIPEYPDAGLCACNYVYYKPGKTHVALNIPTGYTNYPKVYFEQKSMPVTSISICMPRTVFDEFGGFPIGVKLGEDFLLWSQIAVSKKIAFLNKPLAYYNNDVPVSLRATRNLHAPEHHMLFSMQGLERQVSELEDSELKGWWNSLLDMLRVGGLMQYWMDSRYHCLAARELEKVDWNKQPESVVRAYKMPIWWLKGKISFMRLGAFVKQKLIKFAGVK